MTTNCSSADRDPHVPKNHYLSGSEVENYLQKLRAELVRELGQLLEHHFTTNRIGAHGMPPLLSVKDVACVLSVSVRTVETLIAEKKITPIPIRGQRRFDREAIQAYIRAQAHGEGSDNE